MPRNQTKNQIDELPSVDKADSEPAKPVAAAAEIPDPDHQPLANNYPGLVVVPVGDFDPSQYYTRSVDDVLLEHAQAVMFRRIYNGLVAAGERLKNGRVIREQKQVVNWLLERVEL